VRDKEMSKAFNEYFSTVFTVEDTCNVPNVQRMFSGTKEEDLSDLIIAQEIKADKLAKLRINKATGADELSPGYLKEVQVKICDQAVPTFSPHYVKDKFLLERAQHRFTRMITGSA